MKTTEQKSASGNIDESNPHYIDFIECYLRGASLQDIYSSSTHGYGQIEANTIDPAVRARRERSGRGQFMRVFEHLKNIAEPVDQHIGLAGKHVLDFGCGTGSLSMAMALKGAHVVGVDPTLVSLEACACRAKYFGCESRFESLLIPTSPGLSFGDESFDIVILNSVMEFIPTDRAAYVLDFLRVIRPGGHLVISTENGLFPRDYYSKKLFPVFRRKAMIEQNLPYGVTYFELLKWVRQSPRETEDLSVRNWFNSVDKLAARKRAGGRKLTAGLLDGANRIVKGVCRMIGVPSDILLPYAIYIFRVEG